MESYNQSINESFPPNNNHAEEVPLFITYIIMVIVLIIAIIVITPAVMVINVIRWTRELHTKYYFFVANLLVTDVIATIVRSTTQFLLMILYLSGLNSDFSAILKLLISLTYSLVYLMTTMLPMTLAMERMIVISFPYRHRSIMTTKTVVSILTGMWGLSLVFATIITVFVPVDIVWPLALLEYHNSIAAFFVVPRLTSAMFILVVNVFLYYKVVVSNRKAQENERLGNEEEAKQFQRLVQLLRAQIKPTITLLLVGGIDVVGNVLMSVMFMANTSLVEPTKSNYVERFLLYPIANSLLAFHPLVYGLYMKKIRKRLPKCTAYRRLCNTRHSKVVILHQ